MREKRFTDVSLLEGGMGVILIYEGPIYEMGEM